jgi:hypothetical protein
LQNKAAFASLRESRRDYELSFPEQSLFGKHWRCVYLFFGG